MWRSGAPGGGGLQTCHALPGCGCSPDGRPERCSPLGYRNPLSTMRLERQAIVISRLIGTIRAFLSTEWATSTLNFRCRWSQGCCWICASSMAGRPRRPGRHMALVARPSPDEPACVVVGGNNLAGRWRKSCLPVCCKLRPVSFDAARLFSLAEPVRLQSNTTKQLRKLAFWPRSTAFARSQQMVRGGLNSKRCSCG